jgi:hypothetical protein
MTNPHIEAIARAICENDGYSEDRWQEYVPTATAAQREVLAQMRAWWTDEWCGHLPESCRRMLDAYEQEAAK